MSRAAPRPAASKIEEYPNSVEDRVVIVTGASSGIGWAVARRAAHKGFRVVLAARRAERLEALAARIAADGGQAHVVPADLVDLAAQRHLVDEAIRVYGRIDILVNNAGLPLPVPYAEATPEDLRRQWEVNVVALVTLTRLALPHLEASRGGVINIGSMISRFPVPGMGTYSATKIAVAGLTTALRRELTGRGVRVSLVEPGPIATEFSTRAGGRSMAPGGGPLRISAAQAAVPIVRLFDHPRARIVVPGNLGPVLWLAEQLMRLLGPLVDWFYARQGGATPGM